MHTWSTSLIIHNLISVFEFLGICKWLCFYHISFRSTFKFTEERIFQSTSLFTKCAYYVLYNYEMWRWGIRFAIRAKTNEKKGMHSFRKKETLKCAHKSFEINTKRVRRTIDNKQSAIIIDNYFNLFLLPFFSLFLSHSFKLCWIKL